MAIDDFYLCAQYISDAINIIKELQPVNGLERIPCPSTSEYCSQIVFDSLKD